MSNKVVCNICSKSLRQTKSAHYCEICKTWSHLKCNNLDHHSKTWLCKTCKHDIFPFSTDFDSRTAPIRKDLSGLKSLFDELNSLSMTSSDLSEGDFESNCVNCKYYSADEFSSLSSNCKSFSLLHLNISSLEKHFDELSSLPFLLHHSFDIIGISETRLNSSSSSNVFLPNYSFIDTKSTSRAGGVGLYISNKLNSKPREDLNKVLFVNDSLESIFAEISFKNRKNVIVGCVYKHPHMDVEDFNELFLGPLLDKISKENKELILLGDFNIDLLQYKTVSAYTNFLDLIGSYHLLPSITLPTRITSHSNTLIDNIFASPSLSNSISGNLTISISDHLPQFILLDFNRNRPKEPLNFYRNWNKFDPFKFKQDFSNFNWNEVLSLENRDTEASFDSFFDSVSKLIDKHVPLIKSTRKQQKLSSKPWVTQGLLTSMKIRDNFFKDFHKTTEPDLKIYLQSRYKFYRNRIVSLLRLSKKIHFNNFFRSNSNNIKKVRDGVRDLISTKTKTAKSDISLQMEDSLTSDPCTVAESFNEFFTSIATKIRSKIPPTGHHFSIWLKNRNPRSFFISPTTPFEVSQIIQSLQKSKATGPNSIPHNILITVLDEISRILSDIINLSFTTGVFPSKLKQAKVIPVFKSKGSPLEVSNYRPISLLSNIDKILQKLMQKRLSNFLDTCNALYPLQFGFRSNHSTKYALMNCIENINKALDSGKFACSVFIDLQKAFDTVDHNILFSKLNFYGVRGVALSWFKSFLTGRTQYVSVSGVDSILREIIYGVPQGSVLGPLLFLLYINDLFNAIPYSQANLFADDTMLFLQNSSLKSLTKRINLDLKCLCNWLNANMISLNASKTELLIFHHQRRQIDYDIKIKIGGKRLFPSSSVKYLGVYIDSRLTWQTHIDFVCKKLTRANGALCKLRHFVNRETLLTLYFSLFHSHLSYSTEVWAQRNNLHTRRIQTLQKQALRTLTFSEFNAHTPPLFVQCKLLSFFDHVKFLNIIFLHNLLSGHLPSAMSDTFDINDLKKRSAHHPSRAKAGMLRLPKVSTVSFGDYSLTYQSVLSWNNVQSYLPIEDLSTLSLSRLKYLAKFYFLSSYI
jgi:hypothetical protein